MVLQERQLYETKIIYTRMQNQHYQLPNNEILKNNSYNTSTPDQVYFLVLESSAAAIRVRIGPQDAPIQENIGFPSGFSSGSGDISSYISPLLKIHSQLGKLSK